jgi:hypothetical protein
MGFRKGLLAARTTEPAQAVPVPPESAARHLASLARHNLIGLGVVHHALKIQLALAVVKGKSALISPDGGSRLVVRESESFHAYPTVCRSTTEGMQVEENK